MAAEEEIFQCQQCRQTIRPDSSLLDLDLDPLLSSDLYEGALKEEAISIGAASPSTPMRSPSFPAGGDLAKSYIIVDGEKSTETSQHLQWATKLFEMASARTEIDHPLCGDCARSLILQLETELEEASLERDRYAAYLGDLLAVDEPALTEEDAKRELEELEREEQELVRAVEEAKARRARIDSDLAKIEEDEAALRRLEETYWQDYNDFQLEQKNFMEERDSVETRCARAREQLEVLKRANVYNDTFHIWHDGHFGTINNFRLGRLPNQYVEWGEINAGWGQAALLLFTVAKKLGIEFSAYRLVPMGSFSKIIRKKGDVTLDLFGADSRLGRVLGHLSFDKGMAAFLECLRECAAHVQATDMTFRLPYRIEKDKIGDVSIRLQFNTDEAWTKALKFMLTNLKWLLAWACKPS